MPESVEPVARRHGHRVTGDDDRPVDPAQLLELELLAPNRYRARHNQKSHRTTLFGGQVLAQGLMSASRTVAAERLPHSLHAYFLRGGSPELPVDYDVQILRDGRRFSTRGVTASQEGRVIFHMTCGFHDGEEGFDHQVAIPRDVPPPESLLNLSDYMRANAHRLPEDLVSAYAGPSGMELKLIEPETLFFGRLERPERSFWSRVPSAAGIDDPVVHRCLLAFASDYWLVGVAAGQHRSSSHGDGFQIASLDHALWFHRPVRADQWLLYSTDSPSAYGGRGLGRGLLFDQSGILVASVAQEAIMRES